MMQAYVVEAAWTAADLFFCFLQKSSKTSRFLPIVLRKRLVVTVI